jgi:hypothetical protein
VVELSNRCAEVVAEHPDLDGVQTAIAAPAGFL